VTSAHDPTVAEFGDDPGVIGFFLQPDECGVVAHLDRTTLCEGDQRGVEVGAGYDHGMVSRPAREGELDPSAAR
jgi:hypothetical protein